MLSHLQPPRTDHTYRHHTNTPSTPSPPPTPSLPPTLQPNHSPTSYTPSAAENGHAKRHHPSPPPRHHPSPLVVQDIAQRNENQHVPAAHISAGQNVTTHHRRNLPLAAPPNRRSTTILDLLSYRNNALPVREGLPRQPPKLLLKVTILGALDRFRY